MRKIIPLLIFITILTGCRTNKESVIVRESALRTDSVGILRNRLDSLRRSVNRRDSVVIRDSIFVTKTDSTTLIERWHSEYHGFATADTIFIKTVERDTVYDVKLIEIEKEVEKEVIKEINRLKWWQTALMWCGGIALGGVVLFLLMAKAKNIVRF